MRKVAFIGCGGIQGKHLQCILRRQDARVVALMDTTDAAISAFCDKHKFGHDLPRFTDLASLYKSGGFDVVSICTPHTLHFEQAMQALEHGCDVLVEKPMVTDSAQARTLAEKVRALGRTLVIGYNTPATPEVQHLRRCITDGSLGKLELVSIYISQDWMRFTTGMWRQDPALSGGGQAYDSGAHPLSTLLYAVGSDVAEVFAFVDHHGCAVDINSSINIRFANGVLASVVISGNCPTFGNHGAFIFDGGRIDIDPWLGSWINVHRGKDRVKYPSIPGRPIEPMDNLLDTLAGKASVIAGPELGIRMSDLMDAIYASAAQGRPIKPTKA